MLRTTRRGAGSDKLAGKRTRLSPRERGRRDKQPCVSPIERHCRQVLTHLLVGPGEICLSQLKSGWI